MRSWDMTLTTALATELVFTGLFAVTQQSLDVHTPEQAAYVHEWPTGRAGDSTSALSSARIPCSLYAKGQQS